MDTFAIHDARIVSGNRVIEHGWVDIVNGKIRAVGEGDLPPDLSSTYHVCAESLWLVPGFIDMHVHGGGGAEVMDGTPNAIRRIATYHASHGTTGWLPTTLTAEMSEILRALHAISQVMNSPPNELSGAEVLGAHMEGPFLSPDKSGAQDAFRMIPPSYELIEQLLTEVPNVIKKVTLAPEVQNGLESIRLLRKSGVIVSLGHSNATAEIAKQAVLLGASHATHLFNAMSGMHHRDIGLAGVCLLSNNVVCELICDGLHVSWEAVDLVLRVKSPNNVALITDSIGATGCEPGTYRLGNIPIYVSEDKSVLLSDMSTLAGSTLTMDKAVRNLVDKCNVSLLDAVHMASTVPARELGLSKQKGIIDAGFDADLVLLDSDLSVKRTWVRGREAFCAH